MLSSRELPPLLGSPPPKLHPFGNLGAEGKSSVNSSCNGSCCNKTASPQHLSGFDYGSKQLSAYSFGLDPPSSSSSSKSVSLPYTTSPYLAISVASPFYLHPILFVTRVLSRERGRVGKYITS